jgi:hypothetical protein
MPAPQTLLCFAKPSILGWPRPMITTPRTSVSFFCGFAHQSFYACPEQVFVDPPETTAMFETKEEGL